MAEAYSFSLDGSPVTVHADPKTPALEVLREQLGVIGVKAGCSPQGLCGCCTVLVDGKVRLTCTLPTKALDGKSVTTLAGVSEEVKRRLAGGFAATHAAQCGYCTPAIVLSASTLLALGHAPSDDDIHRALAPHTCRCTGYTSIRAAIRLAAVEGESPFDAAPAASDEVVLGLRPFVDDLHRPGTRHGAVVFAGPGTLRAVHVAEAELMPGNVRVVLLKSEGLLGHAGEIVAAVVADSRRQARAAAAAVRAEVDPAPSRAPQPGSRAIRREGDVSEAMAGAAHRAQLTLRFAASDAVPLEPEAAFAVPQDGGLTVYCSVHDAKGLGEALRASLSVPIRVVTLPSGGSYGARVAPSVEPAAAALALACGAPVRVALEHEEGTRLRLRRPGGELQAELGCSAEGRLVAARVHVRLDGGAAPVAGEVLLARVVDALVYDIGAIEIIAELDAWAHSPAGPVRGAGAIPVAAAVEALVDQLAAALGLDRLRIRQRNLRGDAAGLFDVLASLRDHEAPGAWGASVFRAAGGHGAEVVLRVVGAAEVEVQCNVPELGQGRDAELVESLATSTGLPAEVFEVAWGDSEVVGAGAEGPVDAAATAAGRALRAAGGPLGGLVGRTFRGRSGAAPDELAACLVSLADDGGVASVRVLVAAGAQDPAVARSLAEGGAAMGLGVALAEEVAELDAGPETRFRYLGTLKEKVTPRIVATPLDVGGGARGGAEAAAVAAAAATFAAVQAFEAAPSPVLPMKASAAARSVGVRVRGTAAPSST